MPWKCSPCQLLSKRICGTLILFILIYDCQGRHLQKHESTESSSEVKHESTEFHSEVTHKSTVSPSEVKRQINKSDIDVPQVKNVTNLLVENQISKKRVVDASLKVRSKKKVAENNVTVPKYKMNLKADTERSGAQMNSKSDGAFSLQNELGKVVSDGNSSTVTFLKNINEDGNKTRVINKNVNKLGNQTKKVSFKRNRRKNSRYMHFADEDSSPETNLNNTSSSNKTSNSTSVSHDLPNGEEEQKSLDAVSTVGIGLKVEGVHVLDNGVIQTDNLDDDIPIPADVQLDYNINSERQRKKLAVPLTVKIPQDTQSLYSITTSKPVTIIAAKPIYTPKPMYTPNPHKDDLNKPVRVTLITKKKKPTTTTATPPVKSSYTFTKQTHNYMHHYFQTTQRPNSIIYIETTPGYTELKPFQPTYPTPPSSPHIQIGIVPQTPQPQSQYEDDEDPKVLLHLWSYQGNKLVHVGHQEVPSYLFKGTNITNGTTIKPEELPSSVLQQISPLLWKQPLYHFPSTTNSWFKYPLKVFTTPSIPVVPSLQPWSGLPDDQFFFPSTSTENNPFLTIPEKTVISHINIQHEETTDKSDEKFPPIENIDKELTKSMAALLMYLALLGNSNYEQMKLALNGTNLNGLQTSAAGMVNRVPTTVSPLSLPDPLFPSLPAVPGLPNIPPDLFAQLGLTNNANMTSALAGLTTPGLTAITPAPAVVQNNAAAATGVTLASLNTTPPPLSLQTVLDLASNNGIPLPAKVASFLKAVIKAGSKPLIAIIAIALLPAIFLSLPVVVPVLWLFSKRKDTDPPVFYPEGPTNLHFPNSYNPNDPYFHYWQKELDNAIDQQLRLPSNQNLITGSDTINNLRLPGNQNPVSFPNTINHTPLSGNQNHVTFPNTINHSPFPNNQNFITFSDPMNNSINPVKPPKPIQDSPYTYLWDLLKKRVMPKDANTTLR